LTKKKFLFKRFCKGCGVIFETYSKTGKRCPSCCKTRAVNKSGIRSHWKNFLVTNNISEKDLRRYRKSVHKKV